MWEEQVANVIRLHEAGIPFALRTGDFKTPKEFFKNLRLVLERGWEEEAVIAALCTTPGEMLGLAGQLGTIATGRVANLTLMTKPISAEKAVVKMVFIDGKKFEIHRDEKEGEPAAEKDKKADKEKPAAGDEQDAEKTETKKSEEQEQQGPTFAAEIKADRVPKTRTGGSVLIEHATVLPVSSPALQNASVLILDGKIAAIGPDLSAPEGVIVIDGTGRYVIPGLVDCHSHLGLDAVNESALAISAEVRIADVVNPDSVAIYRAVAGGTTTHHVMHGSANPIGGQCAILKLKYGRPVSEMWFADAPRTIKFALGENVKQSNWPKNWGKRFPNTRMGIESTITVAFERARAYGTEWDEYRRRFKAGEDILPPRRDLRLEALGDVLAGKMTVHCHCYRSEEILRLFDVAERFGIRIGTLHHVLEGYRIAPEIARHGAGASTFSNFWAYKVEAYGAIPHNAALMTDQGICSSVNSDSANTIRYLGQEAAKSIRWGGLNYNEALRLVTLNPARQLQIDDRVGSLEVGKDGDVAIFNGHPLDTFSKCVMTIIDGEVYFEDLRPEPTAPAELPPQPPLAKGATEGESHPTKREIPDTVHRAYAIIHVTIHPMSDRDNPAMTIPDGTVVIIEDKIHAVSSLTAGSTAVPIPPGAGVIDGTGLHVYPGLIDAGGRLGLYEIGSLRATRDFNEIGTFHPQLRTASALHPHSEHIRITRAAGITTAVAEPSGGRIAGQSAVFHLNGWTAPEMLVVDAYGLYMSVPSLPVDLLHGQSSDDLAYVCNPAEMGGGGWHATYGMIAPALGGTSGAEEDDPDAKKKKQKEEHKKATRELEEFMARAKHYAHVKELAASDPQIEYETDLTLEAMVPYVRGEKPVVFRAWTYKQILDTLEFAEKHKLRCVLRGAISAWKLADTLAEKSIPVILASPLSYPRGEYEPWDSVYRCAGVLERAGVRFCFATGSASAAYNLGTQVGMAVAHGLSKARAEFAITRGAAEILGIDDARGSISVGKQADLIVTTGTPLQTVTQVTHMFIDGVPIELTSMHTESYEKFKNRPPPRLPKIPELRGPPSLTRP